VLQGLVDGLRSQLKESESTVLQMKTEIDERCEYTAKLQDIFEFVDENLKENTAWVSAREKVFAGELADFKEVVKTLVPAKEEPTSTVPTPAPAPTEGETQPAQATAGGGSGGKKKNKKKKKGGKAEELSKPADAAPSEQSPTEAPASANKELDKLKQKIESLTQQLSEKEAAIDRLSSKLKGEDNLKEEIESLRDDLVNIGQEHVTAKDKIKELSAEKNFSCRYYQQARKKNWRNSALAMLRHQLTRRRCMRHSKRNSITSRSALLPWRQIFPPPSSWLPLDSKTSQTSVKLFRRFNPSCVAYALSLRS
jgi:ATPase involved in DNA repair